MAQPSPSFRPPPVAAKEPSPARDGYSGVTLALTGLATFLAGMIVGVGLMFVLKPRLASEETEAAAASASATAEPTANASTTASASAAPAPTIDTAAAARARRLAELRKKIKGIRSTQLDPQCQRFQSGLPAGYVYDGGSFADNEMVANASGCVALAKTKKAPWFCCKK